MKNIKKIAKSIISSKFYTDKELGIVFFVVVSGLKIWFEPKSKYLKKYNEYDTVDVMEKLRKYVKDKTGFNSYWRDSPGTGITLEISESDLSEMIEKKLF